MTDSIQGPVNSALTQLVQHFEVSMWAEGIGPETALRVLNRVTFGHPDGTPSDGTVQGIPGWVDIYAAERLREIRSDIADAQGPEDRPAEDDVRLVVLALVRQVLQSQPGPIEQALG